MNKFNRDDWEWVGETTGSDVYWNSKTGQLLETDLLDFDNVLDIKTPNYE